MAEIAGVDAEQIVGISVVDGFSPETLAEFQPVYQQAAAAGAPMFYDRIAVRTPAGRPTYQSGWLIPLLSPEGAYAGMYCTVEDVTSSVEAESMLVNSRERFRTLAEFAPVGILEAGPYGDCRFVNQGWCELSGLSPELAMGSGWLDAVHPDDREDISKAWNEYVNNKRPFDCECRFARSDGGLFWVWGSSTPLRDAEGETIGHLGVVVDITDRRANQEELIRQKELANRYLDAADTILVVLDRNGIVIRSNAKADQLLSPPNESITGRDWFANWLPEGEVGATRAVFQKLISGGQAEAAVHENSVVTADGSERIIEWHNTVMAGRLGDPDGVLALGIDITELRRAENVRRETEAKDRFLANMSHELRTPLNSIIGFSGTLLQGLAGELNEEQRRQLKMISDAGGHLLELVSDLLDVEQLASSAVSLSRDTILWGDLVDSAVAQVRHEAETSGLELTAEIQDCDAEFVGDARRIRQILLNLLANAIKFTESGAIRVEAKCTLEGASVSVADTGIGIAPEEIERVFELYHQVPLSNQAKSKGAGLGLPLSRSYARLMGGDLTVQSTPGVGSTFSLWIPPLAAGPASEF